jgi:exoribonuclease-2
MRARLLENGAGVFIPNPLIVANKERIESNNETGTVAIDKEVVYRLGDTLKVVLADVNQETRSLVAKPVEVFAEAPIEAKADAEEAQK